MAAKNRRGENDMSKNWNRETSRNELEMCGIKS